MKVKLICMALVLTFLLAACGGGGEAQKETDDSRQDVTVGENTVAGEETTAGDDSPAEEENTAGSVHQSSAVRLTEMGTVTGNPYFTYGDILMEYGDEGLKLLDPAGIAQNDTVYEDIDSVIGDSVCVASQTGSDGILRVGVLNAATGKELIPCEAVEVRRISDRYLMVGYMTAEATQEEHFGFFVDGSDIRYYNGYGRVLDLEEQRLVPGVEFTNSYMDVTAAGKTIFVDTEDVYTVNAYDPDGKLLGAYEYMNVYPASGLILQSIADGVHVFNGDMEEIALLPGTIYDYDTIDGVDDMLFKHVDGGKYVQGQLIDLTGKELSGVCGGIERIIDGKYLLYHETTDDGYKRAGVMDMNGNVLIPAQFNSLVYCEPGYFVTQLAENGLVTGYDIYDMDGNKINAEPVDRDSDLVYYEKGNTQKVLILETGVFLDVGEGYVQSVGLSLIRTPDNRLIDVITGNTVMEDVERCTCTGNNLYIWDEDTGTYTRYLLELIK